MTTTLTDRTFSFLTTGPSIRLTLPSDFGALPKLSSPLFIHDTFGAREVDFIPAVFDGGMASLRLIGSSKDPDGRQVETYERVELPTIWWLRWSLQQGFLYMHLREEDGVGMADVVVSKLRIVESPAGAPFLLPDPPLNLAVAPLVDFGEHATFLSLERENWAVSLRRPGFLAEGRVMYQPDGDLAIFRVGGPAGIELRFLSGSDFGAGEQLVEDVMNSISAG